MKALIVSNPTSTHISDLIRENVPKPAPKPNEVQIEVKAVGLNPVDYKVVENGHPNWQYPHILGLDVAGVVAAVGADVTQFAVGDRVCSHGDLQQNGCFADFVTRQAAGVAQIPETVSFEKAAASLCAGLTAYQALTRKANLTNVSSVLVHGGAGGVGSMAIQLAKMQGKTVYTTVSSAKRDFVAQYCHPDSMIDYQREDVSARIKDLTHQHGVDLIINTVGNTDADLDRLAFNGQLICILQPPKHFDAAMGQSVACVNLGGAHRSGDLQQVRDLGKMTSELLALIAAGRVDPLITRTIPFIEIAAGLRQLKNHAVTGKIVAVK
ncbi:alcohol dehydrogenase catalytic domain-containing protein [Secundilactobacillus folii]|uniref:Zinc-binding dehydrogenase n=1 Tax=Secundilactobacillus folii TaxID=2678357 RepID=A0A7X2XW96_9LACO|nr:zinc-binding dehydrogenase [Secundilactobacillus folii]MTV82078.1 zinc-binding dehydrogenase [Secundilactobacillus folii]